MKYLSVQYIEEVAYQLAKEAMEWNEPIPDFNTRFPNILERCLAAPRQRFYPTLLSKAGILFYLMIKNHPFQNGNKRIAMVTLLSFLFKNKSF